MVRVAALLLVVWFHSTWQAPLWHAELAPRTFALGYPVGASLLLVVSGYFAAAAVRRQEPWRWWWGRLFRLLPAFWAAVLLTAFLSWEAAPVGWWVPAWSDVGANVLMLWQWKPQLYPYVDASHWTIPIQLVAFTGVLAVCRRPWRRVPGVALLWAALVFEVALWPERVYGGSEPFRMFYDGLGWYRMHLFVAGVAVYAVASGRIGRAHGALLVVACVAAHQLQVLDATTTVGVAAGLLVIVAAAVGPDWDGVVPSAAQPVIRWLAGISYGVYLTHQTLGDIVMRHLQDAGFGPFAQTVGMLATGVLFGWLVTVAVERPAYRALCRLRDRWTGVRAVRADGSAGTGRAAASAGVAPVAVTLVEPAGPVAAVTLVKPVRSAAAVEVVKPVRLVKPGETAGSVKLVKPARSAESARRLELSGRRESP
ncbi:acyltransferase [Yinghuangia aomiensis]|uniref:acyltransferase family protein n=1 Tax=Yinghuangia aomiensis TaxID=676205 RepID=UPI0031ED84E0